MCRIWLILSQECHTSRECMLPSGPHGNMNKPSLKKAMASELAESVRPKSSIVMKYLWSFFIQFSEGPKQEVFSYLLTPDNRTVETIDFGILGGDRLTTAAFENENSLVSYCKNPATGIIDVIATRTILPSNPNIMYFKTKDVAEDYEFVATMIRQVWLNQIYFLTFSFI